MEDAATTDVVKVVLKDFSNLGIKKEKYRNFKKRKECVNEYYVVALMSPFVSLFWRRWRTILFL